MAAELEALIHAYRARGLDEAANALALDKERVLAKGLLPPQLDPILDVSASGCVSLRRQRRLHPGDTYEIDRLDLRIRTRRALLRAGVESIADLHMLLRRGLMSQIRDIGEQSEGEIRERLRRDGL